MKLDLTLCLSEYVYVSVCLCLWMIFFRLICKWALFSWLKEKKILSNQTILNEAKWIQIHVNWDIFSSEINTWWHRHILRTVWRMWFPQFCLTTTEIWNGGPVLQFCYSSEFYSVNKGSYTLKAWGQANPKGEAPTPSWLLLFIHFVSFPPSLLYVN